MENAKELIPLLQPLSKTIELLDNSSRKLIRIMEQQIDAIIGSDTEKIETLSDEHSSLTWHYKEQEKKFVQELSNLLIAGEGEEEHEGIRLLNLKLIFPECKAQIESWHKMLTNNADLLQSKHNQIMQLLEFAMAQNARLMHSMYSKHNEKNSHYGANGNRTDISTGVAVNQEV